MLWQICTSGYEIKVYTMPMTESDSNLHPKDPLHGITLKTILEYLVAEYGWTELAAQIRIKCFGVEPSIPSSLTFLRKTPWARNKVERLYLRTVRRKRT